MLGFTWIQIAVGIATVIGVPAMLSPELKKAWAFITSLAAKKLPTVAAPGVVVTPQEAVQAAETLKLYYGCRCQEAQAKLQAALTHFHDPIVKPVQPPPLNPEAVAHLTNLLAVRPQE